MQRFFADPSRIDVSLHRITLTGPDVNHIKNVLRMRPGEEIHISDGSVREYHCEIEDFPEDEVRLKILYVQEPAYELPAELVLYQGIPKADKMEWIIQKATELGASRIVPVVTKRCIVRLDEKKAEKKQARWQQIAESASKQSGRMKIPVVERPLSFGEAVKEGAKADLMLIPYELCADMGKTREAVKQVRAGMKIGIFIGPEGGFEEDEVALAEEAGAVPISLGKRILRTETAGMMLLSVLMFHLEGGNT